MPLLSLIGTRGLLRAVFGNVSEEVMDSAVLYFTVTSLSFPFLGIYNAGAAIFRSIGNSKISMQISLLMNVINIVGNAIFVFGFHWAVFGVALATLLSRIVAGIVITLLVCGKTNPIRIDKWSELKPDGSTVIDFANIPGNAMGLALITVVGQCIGAGEKKQAKQYTKKLVGLAYLGDWICNNALFLLAGTIAKN